MEKVVYQYYVMCRGVEPNDEDYRRTVATANYLKDNGYSDIEILNILKSCKGDRIEGIDLPENLWNKSLLEKNKFYYSDILHIKSKAPSWNPTTFREECPPFFLEMKINFTMEDLLDYYYENCRVPAALQDRKKDEGALRHLINKYNAFETIPGIDYVIALINKGNKDIDKSLFTSVFEIDKYKEEVIQEFEEISNEVSLQQSNRIVWRN